MFVTEIPNDAWLGAGKQYPGAACADRLIIPTTPPTKPADNTFLNMIPFPFGH
jgi:hypothetical protein